MKIKQIPEDFVVKEILTLPLGEGEYSYYKLWKRDWNTKDAIRFLAERFRIKEKNIGYAGLKDKQAVTEQYISIYKRPKTNLETKDLRLEYLGDGKEKIDSYLIQGNSFIITIRDLDTKLRFAQRIPNYFDDQRFGVDKMNHLAGKLILQRKFKEAVEMLKLDVANNDCVGALKKVDVVFFVNAFQSYLFNKALAKIVEQYGSSFFKREYSLGGLLFTKECPTTELKIPLPNFDFEVKNDEDRIMQEILSEEGIQAKDFVLKQFTNVISETQYRDAFVGVKAFKELLFEDDELNPEKRKQTISFSLPRGSYATIFIKSGYTG